MNLATKRPRNQVLEVDYVERETVTNDGPKTLLLKQLNMHQSDYERLTYLNKRFDAVEEYIHFCYEAGELPYKTTMIKAIRSARRPKVPPLGPQRV